MSDLLNRLNNLSPEKRALLLQRLQQQQSSSQPTPIQRQPRDANPLPLSFAQKRLWVLSQFEPDSPFYNVPIALHCQGQLNVAALAHSLNQVVHRHGSLRTTFVLIDGEPKQAIAPHLTLKLPIVDLRQVPATEREATLQQFATEEACQPFDLAQGPLIRGKILQLAADEAVILVTLHHIISDGWSTGVLVREVAALYQTYCTGESASLPDLPIQYADFAVWQRQWLQTTGEQGQSPLEKQLHYWRQQLGGELPVLQLPSDRARPAVQTFQGATYSFDLPPALADSLKALSQQEGATLFMTLLTAFNVLLYRYTQQTDILVGSPIANRNRSEIESLIGFFVNTLVLRSDLSGNPSFRELLGRVRQVALDAYAHQDLPFEMLVDDLRPERNLSYSPLFQVMFVLQNAPVPVLELPTLKLQVLDIHTRTAKFDLTLLIGETPEGFTGTFEYNCDLFDQATIARLATHFHTLLQGIVADPEQAIATLPLLTATEQQQLTTQTKPDLSQTPNRCLHEWFEAQVEQSPQAIALTFEDQHLTYTALNQQANQLARHLQSLGVGPGTLVGLFVERSLNTVIGILGILKAGGAYVPLDPAYPPERLAFMLEDAEVPVLLTQQSLLAQVPQIPAEVLCLDRDWSAIAQAPTHNPDSGTTPAHLAYIIYTSGSTGKPKGVKVSHANVVRLFTATEPWFHFNNQDVWTLFHSYAFDFSVWEIWGALLYGGRLVVVPYWVSRSPDAFYELLSREQVTVLNQTPSAFRQLIRVEETLSTPEPLALQWVIFGGEALELQSLKPWFERHGDQQPQLVNMYGITETTVHVTYRPITMADVLSGAGSVIGQPIPDLQVYVLDSHQQPVPIGVAGEMYVGGAGVTQGYLNRPELSAERFIVSPYGSDRLYRTGDLARYLPNGGLEYLGRIDHQVKIRGFRIELGEIEATLLQHPAVQDGVVLARANAVGDQQLVAYVVPKAGVSPTTTELRNALKATLPEYMVPAAFVLLETLPLTSNGKLDRKALPDPTQERLDLGTPFVAPRTPAEQTLAQIWAEVLGVEQVGIYDNFFALGGDSIRSIQVRSQAQAQGLAFSLQQLFQHQTIAGLAEVLAETSEQSTTSIAPFSLISESDREKLPPDLEDAYPLTQLQIGMLFHSEYSSGATYQNVSTFHLQATFDPDQFQAALQQLAQRHPVLRTAFDLSTFSEPLQLVHREVTVPLVIEDLRHLTQAEQEQAIAAWFEAEKHRSFDWAQAPLIRFQIHRRSDDTFQFGFTEHHAILDGWSVASMLTELFQLYFVALGQSNSLIEPPPSASLRDFVALEREAIASEACQRYWEEKLSDRPFTSLPRWPQDQIQTNEQIVGGHELTIPTDIAAGLKQVARSLGVPLKSVLLTAHLRVMSLLSSQNDVLTGLVMNGRPETEDGARSLGLFLNTLPYRISVAGGSWRELILQTFAAEQELLPFRRYPLAQLQRSHGGQPLFETAFNFVHFHVYQNVLQLEGGQVLAGEMFQKTNFALMAHFMQDPISAELALRLDYDSTQFAAEQMHVMAGYYLRALEAIAQAPEARYESVSLLSEAERHQVLEAWNQTECAYSLDRCLHEWIEDQVARSPEAVAVTFADQHLTYAELNQRANQLAHHLQRLGVGPEVLVGICVERSLEMVVGLLGILKAGGAYVPFDPGYPQERLAFMLEDAQVPVLLTQSHLQERLPASNAHLICLDRDWPTIAEAPITNPTSGATADNLAYVIYTSGSTGKPKGAMNTHRGICNRLLWMQDAYQIDQRDCILQKTPFSFDVSVWEFFWPLMTGARLVLARPEGHKDPAYLVRLIVEQQVTTLHFVPSMLQIFLEEPGLENCRSIRQVMCSGEALSVELKERFFARFQADLHNLYGPTEAAVDVTFWACQPGQDQRTIPIGRPISNTQLYILDTHLQPVPVGAVGELYIGGVNLARGYLNRPELTQERFIANPFGESGSRLYKTGDLARYRAADGAIEYLGRIDYQVKIRGLRIELGEIESVLRQHPAVQDGVVLAREDEPANPRLVAYIVAQPDHTLTNEDLRNHLQAQLPDYMVPSAFVFLEALPVTANGKLDRRALPAPDWSQQTATDRYIAPRTPTEELLSHLWAQVLGLEQVSVEGNFFELGGHSLSATQLISRIRQTFEIELPLRALFESPTIAALAEQVAIEHQQQTGIALPPISVQALPNQPLPLSFAQQRLWFLSQIDPDSPIFNIPAAIRLTGHLDIAALKQSFEAIAQRHASLRTTFSVRGGQPVQTIAPEITLDLPVIHLQEWSEPTKKLEVQRLIAASAQHHFDLTQGPLLHLTLLQLAETEFMLLVTLHHIIADGWSLGVLVREVTSFYQAFAQGESALLVDLPIQYADFALWQRQWLQGDWLETQLAYWRRQLGGQLPVLQLPTDHPRAEATSFRGGSHPFQLSVELSQALQALSRQTGVTLFMTVLAAFQTLLHRYTQQTDILVGTDVANRNRAETEPLIGFFVNLLVLRGDLSGNPTFRELLERVREVTLNAYAHQDLPFEKLVEVLQPERQVNHTPIFQVLLVLQNTPIASLSLPDLNLEPVAIANPPSKFDLALFLEETEQGLKGTWNYRADLFEASTIARMATQFTTLIQSIVANPDTRLSALELLTAAEREQQAIAEAQREAKQFKKFKAIKPKAVTMPTEP